MHEDSRDPERWLPVPGHEGWYEISTLGRARSVDRVIECTYGDRKITKTLTGVVLKTNMNRHGYHSVGLSVAARRKRREVHRLVLLAFVGPPPDRFEGCHNDGNCTNNRLSNLRWDTRSANTLDRALHNGPQDVCGRGHDLVTANLMPGKLRRGFRACLACNRARSLATDARKAGRPEINLQEVSDVYYRQITAYYA